MRTKKIIAVILGTLFSVVSFAQTATVEQGLPKSSESTNPDTIFWILGAVLVVLFIFVVILALAKGTMALSENLEDKYKEQNHLS
jgi:ABC-type transport system involved in multi-copper enzyme maturation permease subunit